MLKPIALLLGLAAAAPALAHHGWSNYDTSRIVTVTAPVEKLTWGFPHVQVWLGKGEAQRGIVLAPPSRMTARGLSETMLKAGTEISVDGYQSREHPREMRAERVRVGGKSYEMR